MTLSASLRICNAVRFFARVVVVTVVVTLSVLLCATPAAHATLNNDEPATDLLGEFNSPSVDTTADFQKGCPNNGASSLG